MLVRIVDGELKKGQKIRMMAADAVYQVEQVGVFTPKKVNVERLAPGEVGFITAQIKQVADTQVGDTITDETQGHRDTAARLQAGAAGGVLRPVPGRRGAVRRSAQRARHACISTMRASPMRWKPAPRWASASAAGS